MFEKFIDDYGFIDEQGAIEMLESLVSVDTLNRFTRIWSDCPDLFYSQKEGRQYAFSEIAEIFRKNANCYLRGASNSEISIFISYRKAHAISALKRGRKVLLNPPQEFYREDEE